MPEYGDLTDLQLMILSVLWSEREATIGAIHDRLAARGPVSRKTVATILSRLERRRLVARHVEGREGVYRARVAKRAVLRSRAAKFLGALFPPHGHLAGARALDPSEVDPGDVDRLVAMLRQLQREVKDAK
ncbi:MAG TPA: BlaI/MecI/CopY family transcriptional regulator [Gemmatimonadaceae bacterium]|nr:BlaI/MecI/CopY family transcriptional regulator [Gemmatimonadaceae bacterium]